MEAEDPGLPQNPTPDSFRVEAESLRKAYEESRAVQGAGAQDPPAPDAGRHHEGVFGSGAGVAGGGGDAVLRPGQAGAMVLYNRTGDTAIRRQGGNPGGRRKSCWSGSPGAPDDDGAGTSEKDWHVLVPLVVAGEASGILVLDVPQAAGTSRSRRSKT